MSLVDMHIHSYYTDGTMSPQEILKEAVRKGIGTLAVTDHDVLEGARELLRLVQQMPGEGSPESGREGMEVHVIPGVELTGVQDGATYHILGYGVDLEQEAFCRFVRENRTHLDGMNDELIEKMEQDYPVVSRRDYESFVFEPGMGGWKALHYLKARGLAESLADALKYYGQYRILYEEAGFADVVQICEAIHGAGGVAVLAHPGKVLPTEDPVMFEEKLNEILNLGLDGVECWYPTHTEEIRDICLRVCHEKDLLITCGSDSHGDFEVEDVPMGILPVTEEDVNIGSL